MPIMKNARRHGSQDEKRSRKRVNTEGGLETFNSFTVSESLTLPERIWCFKITGLSCCSFSESASN